VLALALSADESVRGRQLAVVGRQLGATRAALCQRLFAELQGVDARLRLPVVELAMPALKQRPAEQLAYLRELVARVVEIDKAPRLFDFALLKVIDAYLRRVPGAHVAAAGTRTVDARAAVRGLLRNVAAFGHGDSGAASKAYAAGLAVLGWQPDSRDPSFEPLSTARNLTELDAALNALTAIKPRDKERVLRAVLGTIRADAVVATEERELFRLIAATLDCPLPQDVDI